MEFIIKSPKYGNISVLIDDEDYEKIKDYTWFATKKNNDFYITHSMRSEYNLRSSIRLHRIIMNCPKNKMVDHINHDTLDNRKCNLRICTHSENIRNSRKRKNTSSIYKGVRFHKRDKKWIASITLNKNNLCLGYFNNEKLAGIAYNEAAIKYHGEFASLNDIE